MLLQPFHERRRGERERERERERRKKENFPLCLSNSVQYKIVLSVGVWLAPRELLESCFWRKRRGEKGNTRLLFICFCLPETISSSSSRLGLSLFFTIWLFRDSCCCCCYTWSFLVMRTWSKIFIAREERRGQKKAEEGGKRRENLAKLNNGNWSLHLLRTCAYFMCFSPWRQEEEEGKKKEKKKLEVTFCIGSEMWDIEME